MPVEEGRRPEEVQGELDAEQEEGFAAIAGNRAGLGETPDAPCCDGHEGVEDDPDGVEEPVGWVEGGLGEGGVPGGDGWGGDQGSSGRYCAAEDEEADEGRPG